MASDNILSSNLIHHDYPWQTLIEFSLSRKPDQEQLALEQVAKAVQTLNWPLAHLEQLELALAQATRNAKERIHLVDSETWLVIRVLIPEGSEVPQATDKQSRRQVSEKVPRQMGQPTARGWGFFLVQKYEDKPQAITGESQHVIELFLYQESHLQTR